MSFETALKPFSHCLTDHEKGLLPMVQCHHRLMTYALIASKMATLIAIMTKKNFPISASAHPNANQRQKFRAGKRKGSPVERALRVPYNVGYIATP